MQSWWGQSNSFATAVLFFVGLFAQWYGLWVEPLSFKRKRTKRLNAYDISHRAQAPSINVNCGDLTVCQHPLCRQLILSYEGFYRGLYRGLSDLDESAASLVTMHAIDLNKYPHYQDYRRELGKRSSFFLRHANKALKAGYRVERFEASNFSPDIVSIHRSLKFRSFGIMFDAFFMHVGQLGGPPKLFAALQSPSCNQHWECLFGVFVDRPDYMQGDVQTNKQLLGYARLHRIGNVIAYRDFMGHGQFVGDGIMKLLHVHIVQWILDSADPLTFGIEQIAYGSIERGNEGLFFWKKKSLFAPFITSLVEQKLPSDFNVHDYLRLNPDIAKLKIDPILHYQLHGQLEKRFYKVQIPEDFDARNYLRLNPDVICAIEDAELHYTKHGFSENRQY